MAGERIPLARGDFYELKAKLQAVTLLQMEARALVARIPESQAACNDLFARLGETYRFDPKENYTLDDETCQLVPADVKG